MKNIFTGFMTLIILGLGSCKDKEKEVINEIARPPLAEVPMELMGSGIAVIKASINDDGNSYNFLFDTGATEGVLDDKIATKLKLFSNFDKNISAGGGSQNYGIIYNQSFELQPSNLKINDASFVVADFSAMKDSSPIALNGILGYDIPRRYITQLDYENRKMVLYDRITDVDLEGYDSIPFQFKNDTNIPSFPISFKLKNGNKYTGSVLLDTGADLGLAINYPFVKNNRLDEQVAMKLTSSRSGFVGSFPAELISVETVAINDFEFSDVPIELFFGTEGATADDKNMGLIGVEFIHRFHVVLDYLTKTMYLKPNKFFERTFVYPMSGLELEIRNDKVVVLEIPDNTPAYRNGLRPGDVITSINGHTSSKLKEYYDILNQGAEGDEIVLVVSGKNGQEKIVRFKLKRLI